MAPPIIRTSEGETNASINPSATTQARQQRRSGSNELLSAPSATTSALPRRMPAQASTISASSIPTSFASQSPAASANSSYIAVSTPIHFSSILQQQQQQQQLLLQRLGRPSNTTSTRTENQRNPPSQSAFEIRRPQAQHFRTVDFAANRTANNASAATSNGAPTASTSNPAAGSQQQPQSTPLTMQMLMMNAAAAAQSQSRPQPQTVTQAFMHLRQYFADNYRRRPGSGPGIPNHSSFDSTRMQVDGDDGNEHDEDEEDDDSEDFDSDCDEREVRIGVDFGAGSTSSNIRVHRQAGQREQLQQQISRGRDFAAFIRGQTPQIMHQQQHRQMADNIMEYPSAHSHFRYKIVCRLNCRFCTKLLCSRGMKAILLADTKVELYSTDTPPSGVALVNGDYMTENCRCKIHDVACLGCGNVVGYHVTQPCDTCLDSCNNGHFWMFQMEGVVSSERSDPSAASKPLLWAFLPAAERDREIAEMDGLAVICR
eukprot:Partr_v1_DN27012_c0_g1_i1_m28906 putative family with sequence similarity 72, member